MTTDIHIPVPDISDLERLTPEEEGMVQIFINLGDMVAEQSQVIADKNALIAHQREQIRKLRYELEQTRASWDAQVAS